MHIQAVPVALQEEKKQQQAEKPRPVRRSMALAALGLAVASLGIAMALQRLHIAGLPGLGLAWIGVFGAAWIPMSALTVRRARETGAANLADSIAAQAQLQIELFRSTRRDALTGLPSRAAFAEILGGLVSGGKKLALLVIDLDDFDRLNGMYGDGTGDDVLRAFADRLRRIADHREYLARLDGDEFALVLDKPDDLKFLDTTTGQVLQNLCAPYAVSGSLVDVRASIGIALAPEHGGNAETLLRAARVALRRAKSGGGAGWRLCEDDESEAIRQRAQMRADLSRAIEEGEIVPWYQPIVKLPSAEIAKFEVLARWNHPSLGLLEPEKFIPLAAELGLLGHLTMGLLRHVAVDMMQWPEWCRFSINVSAGQLRELIGFVGNQPGDWQRRMDLTRLDVEITEAALIEDQAMAHELIAVLHEHGARAGLDDFGSGFSNVFHLRDMPFDFIKIGKAFVGCLIEDIRAESCVLAMLWLGHGLGIDMVANGVESAEVADRLGKMGCQFAQGYLYSRPVAADGVADLLSLPRLGDTPAKTGRRSPASPWQGG